MKKIKSEFDILQDMGDFKDKVIIDVGCGTGELVRKLAAAGALVTGIDVPEMLEKAKDHPPAGKEKYIEGTGENLPLNNDYADMAIFFASFHHIPVAKMKQALNETHRVLKNGGTAVFIEPVGQKGSYYEIIRLVEDEREVQKQAYDVIRNATEDGLENKNEAEDMFYIERSFADYVKLNEIFIEDEKERGKYISRARKVTTRLARAAGTGFEDFRYKSICRLNILKKNDV